MLYCNEEDELVPLPSFNEIFDSLKTGKVTRGVIPVENSLEGAVNLCMDLLYTSSFVEVVGEMVFAGETVSDGTKGDENKGYKGVIFNFPGNRPIQ